LLVQCFCFASKIFSVHNVMREIDMGRNVIALLKRLYFFLPLPQPHQHKCYYTTATIIHHSVISCPLLRICLHLFIFQIGLAPRRRIILLQTSHGYIHNKDSSNCTASFPLFTLSLSWHLNVFPISLIHWQRVSAEISIPFISSVKLLTFII